jgi:hypothetical protein
LALTASLALASCSSDSGSDDGRSSPSGTGGATGDGSGGTANAAGTGASANTSGGSQSGNTGGSATSSGGSGGQTSAAGAGGESVYYGPGDPLSLSFETNRVYSQTETECNGIDDDGNGIIDDVDANGDGVCDCLRVATLGRIGIWGTGNIFTEWLNSRGAEPAVALGDQTLTPELLAGFQVIVALNASTLEMKSKGVTYPGNHAYAASEVDALGGWVRNGGGFMTTIGYSSVEGTEIPNINLLLSPLGLGYDGTKLDTDGYVTKWAPHPTTDGMGTARIQNGVRPLETGAGTTVAWDEGNRASMRVAEVDGGRVVVWGDEWITYDADWSNTTSLNIELFWLNLLKWLTPPTECQVPIPPRVK